jgi:hypothetical protein
LQARGGFHGVYLKQNKSNQKQKQQQKKNKSNSNNSVYLERERERERERENDEREREKEREKNTIRVEFTELYINCLIQPSPSWVLFRPNYCIWTPILGKSRAAVDSAKPYLP